MSDALVSLEAQFPFNLVSGPAAAGGGPDDQSGALFGIGRSLYFCIPQNQNLLAYWDTVADRLFKIRNSENIQGVVQQLPLFDPPLDPGMLVKAAAAGIDIGSIVSGLNQPLGPVRSLLLIQKALEIAGEVRSLGSELLSALEKGDAEQLALLRQGHEIPLQQMTQNVRYLQWQHAQETTNGLLKTRDVALERYTYYLRLLNLAPDQHDRAARLHPGPARADRGELRRHLQRAGRRVRPRDRDAGLQPAAASPGHVAVHPVRRDRPGPALPEQERGRGAQHAPAQARDYRHRGEHRQHHRRRRYPDSRARKHIWPSGASAFTPSSSRAGPGRVAKIAADDRAGHRGLAAGPGGHRRPHRRLPAARRRVDPAGEPGRA